MLKRCCRKYGDRWCRLHGKCSCIALGDDHLGFEIRVWDRVGSNPDCPLHGVEAGDHPRGIRVVLTGERQEPEPLRPRLRSGWIE